MIQSDRKKINSQSDRPAGGPVSQEAIRSCHNAQRYYDHVFRNADFASAICPFCGCTSCLMRSKPYPRRSAEFDVQSPDGDRTVRSEAGSYRARKMCCSSCQHFHAALSQMNVPYGRYSYDTILDALYPYFSGKKKARAIYDGSVFSKSSFYRWVNQFKADVAAFLPVGGKPLESKDYAAFIRWLHTISFDLFLELFAYRTGKHFLQTHKNPQYVQTDEDIQQRGPRSRYVMYAVAGNCQKLADTDEIVKMTSCIMDGRSPGGVLTYCVKEYGDLDTTPFTNILFTSSRIRQQTLVKDISDECRRQLKLRGDVLSAVSSGEIVPEPDQLLFPSRSDPLMLTAVGIIILQHLMLREFAEQRGTG